MRKSLLIIVIPLRWREKEGEQRDNDTCTSSPTPFCPNHHQQEPITHAGAYNTLQCSGAVAQAPRRLLPARRHTGPLPSPTAVANTSGSSGALFSETQFYWWAWNQLLPKSPNFPTPHPSFTTLKLVKLLKNNKIPSSGPITFVIKRPGEKTNKQTNKQKKQKKTCTDMALDWLKIHLLWPPLG